jgi:hypothetical protein
VPAQRSCNISSTRYWPEKDANEFRNCDGEEDLGFKTNLSNSGTICSNTELEKANIIDITNEELSLEDRQAMEEFMKKKAEQDRQAIKELMKEMAEKNQFYYLSHFKKNHHGNFKKTNEIITFDTPPTEVPPNVTANDFQLW